MPRKARIDATGALHHITVRGIERCDIFRNDDDRDNFLERLGKVLSETNTPCYAWALIPNHFHLLLQTGSIPISNVIRRLLTGYALYYNKKHRRHGHLFQNRFKSSLCQKDSYFLELVLDSEGVGGFHDDAVPGNGHISRGGKRICNPWAKDCGGEGADHQLTLH